LRQRLYIGKLLRRIDVGPIREALSRRGELDRRRVIQERAVEQWRARLLADEPGAWSEIAALIAADNLQELRNLAARARAEQAAARPPAAARQLFRRLREALPGPDATMRR
jgi:ribosome-associated protein